MVISWKSGRWECVIHPHSDFGACSWCLTKKLENRLAHGKADQLENRPAPGKADKSAMAAVNRALRMEEGFPYLEGAP